MAGNHEASPIHKAAVHCSAGGWNNPIDGFMAFSGMVPGKAGNGSAGGFQCFHKAGGFMVYGRFTGLPGIIPVNRKVVLYGSRPYGGFVNSAVCSFVNTAQGWGFSQRS